MHVIGAAQSGALKNVIATTQAQRAAGSAGSDAPELTQEARDAVDRRTFEAEVEVFAQRHVADGLADARGAVGTARRAAVAADEAGRVKRALRMRAMYRF